MRERVKTDERPEELTCVRRTPNTLDARGDIASLSRDRLIASYNHSDAVCTCVFCLCWIFYFLFVLWVVVLLVIIVVVLLVQSFLLNKPQLKYG